MGQLEKYGLYVLCLVIFLILGVTIWGNDEAPKPGQTTPSVAMHAPGGDGLNGIGGSNAYRDVSNANVNPIGADLDELLGPADRPHVNTINNTNNNPPVVDNGGDNVQPVGPSDASMRRGNQNVPVDPVVTPIQPTPALRTYVIKSGDTLGEIAQAQCGSTRFVAKIEELNPGLDARRLRVGKKIKLPAKGSTGAAGGSSNALSRAGAYRTYTIVKGDNLENIARTELGSRRRVKELRNLNPKLDPRRMRPGQKIRLPLK